MIDYLADFHRDDTAVMRGIWFHLIDVLQECAAGLPHEHWEPNKPKCAHAHAFTLHYDQILEFVNQVIESGFPVQDADEIVRPAFPLTREATESSAGGIKAGLKPWQQFLYNGSPGFAVPKSQCLFPDDDVYNSEYYTETRKVAKEIYVPMGALGIVAKHTERARELAKKLVHVSSPMPSLPILVFRTRFANSHRIPVKLGQRRRFFKSSTSM